MYQVRRKGRGALFYVVLFLCAFAVGLGIGYGGVKMNLWQQDTEAVPEAVQTVPDVRRTPVPDRPAAAVIVAEEAPTATPEPVYFVVEQAGTVCVFTLDENGERQFSHNLAIELEALRPEDQQLFADGITVNSREELLSLMEDFSS